MRLGLVLVGVLGERQLAHQDLARLGQHPLLAGRQAAVLVATPQVTHDLGDLDHVAGGELLEVGLVAAGPVGRLLGVRGAQDLEDLVQSLLPDDVADADEIAVLGRNPDGQVALGDLQNEVELVLALDGARLDGLDQCRPVVGVDDRLADLERHIVRPLSRYPG